MQNVCAGSIICLCVGSVDVSAVLLLHLCHHSAASASAAESAASASAAESAASASASASTSASASASASAAYLLPDGAGRQVSWVGPVSPEKKNFQSNMWPLKEIKHKKAKNILAKYLSASQLTCSSHYCAAAPPMYHCSILRLPAGNRKRICYEKCTTDPFLRSKIVTTRNISGDFLWHMCNFC